jgi:Peptidase family M23
MWGILISVIPGRGSRRLLAAVLALVGSAVVASGAAAAPPTLRLPWPTGQSWIYLGGPHNTNGCPNGGFTCINPRPWNSLDFTTASRRGTVTAATSGVVESTNQCPINSNFVIIDHGGGWHTTYYHLINIRVHAGQHVVAGQPLGAISATHGCGGHADVAHVHFSVADYSGPYSWHKGQIDLGGVRIGDWVFHDGATQYSGCATNVSTGRRVCPGGVLTNDSAVNRCGDTNAVTSIVGNGVGCKDARRVVDTWAKRAGCGPNGQPCQVLGFSCVVPATNRYSQLECTAGDRSVTGRLRPF